MTRPSIRSFLRSWGLFVAFVIAALVFITVSRQWAEAKAEEPIGPEHKAYLLFIAGQVPAAQAYLHDYYESTGRDTVAAGAFPVVCAALTTMADAARITVDSFSKAHAEQCRYFADNLKRTAARAAR